MSATMPGLSEPIEWMTTTFFAGAENCLVVTDGLLKIYWHVMFQEDEKMRTVSRLSKNNRWCSSMSLRHAFLTLEQIRREEGTTARAYSAVGNTMMISYSGYLWRVLSTYLWWRCHEATHCVIRGSSCVQKVTRKILSAAAPFWKIRCTMLLCVNQDGELVSIMQ